MTGPPSRWAGVSGWWRTHPLLADALLVLLVLAVSLQPLFSAVECGCDPVPPWGYALVVAQCLPLAWRRRLPFTVVMVTGALTTVYGLTALPDPVLPFAGLVALYSVAAYATRRLALVAAAVATLAIAVSLAVDPPGGNLQDAAVQYLTFATAWLLGDAARSRWQLAAELQARAEHLERSRAAEARQAVAEERTRIAREMHDVLTHSVSLMVVQAEAGPVVVERDPARAVAAFDAISATGKRALAELRRLLGVLRDDQVDPLAPQPGVAQIGELVDGARRAGLEVHLRVSDLPQQLPVGVDLSAYRIVQEALTNVAKHAGPARVTVTVDHDGDDLRVEVADDGLAVPSASPGRGLLGMRERAASLGGTVSTGPAPGGGWVVRATLPLTPVVLR
jgi:signal transduction histidine kinase